MRPPTTTGTDSGTLSRDRTGGGDSDDGDDGDEDEEEEEEEEEDEEGEEDEEEEEVCLGVPHKRLIHTVPWM